MERDRQDKYTGLLHLYRLKHMHIGISFSNTNKYNVIK